jgi:hypothetical protein
MYEIFPTILTAVNMEIAVLWDVTPSNQRFGGNFCIILQALLLYLEDIYRRFGGIYCLHVLLLDRYQRFVETRCLHIIPGRTSPTFRRKELPISSGLKI